MDQDHTQRQATPKLIEVLIAVAQRQGVDLKQLLHERHQVEQPEKLTMSEITGLINQLTMSAGSPKRSFQTSQSGGCMAKDILFDQIHVSIYVPRGLTEAEGEKIKATLDAARFQRDLRQSIKEVVACYATLVKAKVRLSR